MTQNGGWVKLYRKIQDSPALKGNPQREFVFIKIIMNAAYEDGDGLQRGQWRTTLRELARMTGLTPQQVSRHLGHLSGQKADMIRTETGQDGTVITVCNYSEYQDGKSTAGRKPDKSRTETGHQTGHTHYTKKDLEEDKKEELELCATEVAPPDPFDELWDLYGFKVGKKPKARQALKKALKSASVDQIADGIRRYRAWLEENTWCKQQQMEFWLNGERWNDELDVSRDDGASISDEEADRLLAEHMRQQEEIH